MKTEDFFDRINAELKAALKPEVYAEWKAEELFISAYCGAQAQKNERTR